MELVDKVNSLPLKNYILLNKKSVFFLKLEDKKHHLELTENSIIPVTEIKIYDTSVWFLKKNYQPLATIKLPRQITIIVCYYLENGKPVLYKHLYTKKISKGWVMHHLFDFPTFENQKYLYESANYKTHSKL